jgi:sugar/nucleoside kinase (ribokinase family)
MNAMKMLAGSVLVLVLAGTVAGCGKSIEGTITNVETESTVSDAGMVSTGVATVVLEDGTEVSVQMDEDAMNQFNEADSARMKLSEESPGEYVFAGMVK